MNRRTFLEVGSSLAVAPIFMGAKGLNTTKAPKNKAVVFLFLSGGPAVAEFTHSHPEMLGPYRSTIGEIQTKTPDLFLGSLYPELAKRSDKINVVKSFGHTNAAHQGGTYFVTSGHNINTPDGTPNSEPSYGAIASHYYGTNHPNGMPKYVRTSENRGADGGGWLGGKYTPFDANDNGKRDLTLNIPMDRFGQRLEMLKAIDRKNMSFSSNQSWKAANELRAQAASMITGDLKKVFDPSFEDEATKKKYGNTNIGNSLLLAKRLIVNGAQYINVNYGGWDLHTDIKQGTERLVPPMDMAISAFIDEMEALGLSEDVLLVVTGEFSRTKLNMNNGRDHYAHQTLLVTYGGKYEKGRVIGKSSNKQYEIESEPFGPKDLAYTIFNHMQIPTGHSITDMNSRPRFIVEEKARLIL
jgi:hypothetical protein